MKARTGDGALSSRCAVLFLALAVLAAAFLAAPSHAQAQEDEPRIGILNRLFGRPAYRVEEPRANVAKPKAERTERSQRKKARARRDNDEPPPPVAVISKHPDARVVLVIGDFLGSGLAEGLTTAFTEIPNVRIVDRTSGSSGFVREDFHNWPEKIGELITAERPAAVIVMIGANDRQQMLVDGVRETVRSENWNKEYAERASELAKAIAARKVPFLWVGMPPFKSSKMMLDMLAFNDVYRAAATGAGGEYVDIWDAFVDENGAYAPSGPDINGQPARLRANDGINLARPGKRKIAFYAEKPLYKLLGLDPTAAAAATAVAPRSPYRIMGPFGPAEVELPSDIDVVVNPNELAPLDASRPVFLRTPGLDGGEELLGMVAEPRHEARTPAEKLAIEGLAPAPQAGRADQFAGPQVASAATAARAIAVDRTTNKVAAPSVLPEAPGDRAELRLVRSDASTAPPPEAPLPIPPEIRPDRLDEISPAQAAPDIAALPPSMTSPATQNRATVPDFAAGDPKDRSPSRAAPRESYKRPKSIGPEPNRAPTAVPPPVEQILAPAEVQPEVPSASTGEGAAEPVAEAQPALPDTAPARAGAPSLVQEPTADPAPARGAPAKADPVPVAALPVKDVPTALEPVSVAPAIAAPNAPVEPAEDVSVAKAAPSTILSDDADGPPSRTVPTDETLPTGEALPVGEASAPAQAPVPTEPAALPEASTPTPDAAAPAAAGPQPAAPTVPTETVRPATPVAPAPPTLLPTGSPAPREKAEALQDEPAGPAPAAQPSSSTPG